MVLRSSRVQFFSSRERIAAKKCAGLVGIKMADAPKCLLLFSNFGVFLPFLSQVAVLPSAVCGE